LSKRFYRHKCKAKQRPNVNLYKCFNEIGWDKVKIVLIEEHYLENREQQLREEDRVIQMYVQDENCINSYRPWISDEDRKKGSESKSTTIVTQTKSSKNGKQHTIVRKG